MRELLRGLVAASAAAASALGVSARAQTAPGDEGPGVAQVVVTASKREQRLEDVPYAVTSVGAVEIQSRGSLDIKDLQYSVPGLNITPGALGQDRIAMRGINAGFGTGLPVVGVYVDDVGVSVDQQQRDSSFPLVDLDRVEVLRGPQGTLYGQGSEAGTIRYVTHNPSLTRWDGFFEGNAYDQNEGATGGRAVFAAGGPLIADRLGLRLVAGYEDQAGWIDYPKVGRSNANETTTDFLRAKAIWRPMDGLSVDLLLQTYWARADAPPFAYQGSTMTNATRLDPTTDRSNLAGLTVNYDVPLGRLTSATSYIHRNYLFQFPFPFPYLADQDTRFEQTSEELRFVSKQLGPVNFTTGLFYRSFDAPTLRTINTTGYPAAVATALHNAITRSGTDPVNSLSYAIFGDGTYSVTPQIDFSVGLRYYTDDRQSINITTTSPITILKSSFDSVDPRFNVRYKINSDVAIYAQAAKGFRSGGFNTTPKVPTYGPEDLWDYEGGIKGNFLNGRLFVDAAVYYLDYSNRQSQSLVNVSGLQLASTTNGGSASGPGAEFAASAKLPYNLIADVTVSYNDVTFDKTTIENRAGDRFGLVAPWTGGASLSQRLPTALNLMGSPTAVFWRLDYQDSDPSSLVIRGANAAGQSVVLYSGKAQTQNLLNLHFGVDVRPVTLTFEALNLTDSRAVVYPFLGYGPGYNQTLRPRTVGVTLRYDFR